MSALDKDTFALYTEEHQKYLDAKFGLICVKLDAIVSQRAEDCEDCERHRGTCQGHYNEKFSDNDKKHKATRVALVAGLFLTMVIGSALEGHISLMEFFAAIGRILPF